MTPHYTILLRGSLIWSLLFVFCLGGPKAHAQAAATHASAAAQTLFDQGIEAMRAGDYASACAKLGESQRIDPGFGTLFNLAECFERTGRTASAWGAYMQVYAETHAAGQSERETLAKQRADTLSTRLATLTIESSTGQPSDLTVECDGVAVGAAQWGIAIPMDPGEHRIVARASEHQTFETKVLIPEDAAAMTVLVPTLVRAEPALAVKESSTVVERSTTEARGMGRRLHLSPLAERAFYLSLGGGGAMLLVAGAAGVTAMVKRHSAAADCQGSVCNSYGFAARTQAGSWADVSTIAFATSGALLATATTLWLVGFRRERRRSAGLQSFRVVPSLTWGRASLTWRQQW